MNNTPENIIRDMDRVESRYNPENDVPINGPLVTYTDEQLIEAVRSLSFIIDKLLDDVRLLQDRVIRLEKK